MSTKVSRKTTEYIDIGMINSGMTLAITKGNPDKEKYKPGGKHIKDHKLSKTTIGGLNLKRRNRTMKITGYLLIVSLAVFMMGGASFADQWSEDVVKQLDAITALEQGKQEMPASMEGVPVVNGEEVHKIWKSHKAAIIDTRNKTQYDTERIEGAHHLSSDDLIKDPALANSLDKEKEYIVYCNGVKCPRSPRAAIMLKSLGFKKVYWYREGMPDWKSKGYPTE